MQWIPGLLSPSPSTNQKAWGRGYMVIGALMVETHTHLKVQCIHFQEDPQWHFVCLQVCSQEMLICSKEREWVYTAYM
jgi:hypothetical protein